MSQADTTIQDGVCHWPGLLDGSAQQSLLESVRNGIVTAPLFTPVMPRTGKKMSVRMTNFGSLGWVTDKQNGYRYQKTHPETGTPWPDIPDMLQELWSSVTKFPLLPQACLVNFYDDSARMGMHQDRDEENLEAPVLSISLGIDCLFRVGGNSRRGKTHSFRLRSGDVMMLAGNSRLAYHGVDRIYPDTSSLLKDGGRLNLTLRRVT